MTDRITVEFRAASIDGNTLSGTAHVFGQRANIRGAYIEEFAPTAFDRVLADPRTDVRAFWQHDPRMLLGRQSSGSLRLERAPEGLKFSIDLPDTSYANDLKALVSRGDLTEMSFAFMPGKYQLRKAEDGSQVRTHTDVRALIDVSPVSIPAFAGTGLALRSDDLEGIAPRAQAVAARWRAARKNVQ